MVPESKTELLFHPIRMRIITALTSGRQLTAQQLAETLQDVPLATLYRHLNTLTAAELLCVVEKRQVRNTVEKVYALPDADKASPSAEDLQTATPEQHMRFFTAFVASLLGSYGRYLSQPGIDPLHDGVGYRTYPFYLSDQEMAEFAQKMGAIILEAIAKEPGPGRRRRSLSTIFIPDPEE